MHLPIPLPLLVLGRTGRGDQGRIDDRDLAHRHYSGTEVGFVGLKDLLAEFMLHQQVPEGDNRCLIGDPVAHQLDAGKAPHRGNFNQGLRHGWVTAGISLVQQENAPHGGQRIRRSAAFLPRLWVVGLDQSDQHRPRHKRLHLREKLLALGLLPGCGQLVIREAELLATL